MSDTAGIYRQQFSFESNFTQIPNTWLRDPKLSMQAKGLLAYFMSHDVGFRLTFTQIVNQNKDGKHAIRSAVNELVEVGYLITERTHTERGYNSGLSYFLVEPENPKSENPTLENPTLENQTAYIENNLVKENKLNKEPTRATRIPKDFAITEQMREWAKENHPLIDIETETLNFIDYWEAKARDNTKLDWYRTWQKWIRSSRPKQLPIQRKPKNDWDALREYAKKLEQENESE